MAAWLDKALLTPCKPVVTHKMHQATRVKPRQGVRQSLRAGDARKKVGNCVVQQGG